MKKKKNMQASAPQVPVVQNSLKAVTGSSGPVVPNCLAQDPEKIVGVCSGPKLVKLGDLQAK